MLGPVLDTVIKPFVRKWDKEYLHRHGAQSMMQKAKRYNDFRYSKFRRFREIAYQTEFEQLLEENGEVPTEPCVMKDGWAIDDSGTLPHLEQLLTDAAEIIEDRKGEDVIEGEGRTFFRNIIKKPDLVKYPSILNFATSSKVLSTVCNYLGFIPALTGSTPPGVRLAESNAKFDAHIDKGYRESQLFHLDPYDFRVMYVIVALKEITVDCGPFSFFGVELSDKARKGLGYRQRGIGHRVTDKEMYEVVDESQLQRLCCPPGTVLFFDSSRCFHYGSRDSHTPRYQMMYAYVSCCRTDFVRALQGKRYSTKYCNRNIVKDSDSRLRKMVLNPDYMPG